jgi:hypothetical protein
VKKPVVYIFILVATLTMAISATVTDVQEATSQESGYSLTVHVTSHQFWNPTVYVRAQTANGNYDQTYTVSIQNPAVTFSIPPIRVFPQIGENLITQPQTKQYINDITSDCILRCS